MASSTPAPADAVIAVNHVSKHYGSVHAVDGVSLHCARGELYGLIGHNGAGKSTLFKMMLGLIPVTAGEIHIDGENVAGKQFRNVRRKIGYLPENIVLYDNLTGLETLQFFARLKGLPQENGMAILERVGLQHAAQRRVSGYSKGMRQRLGFAQALLGKPQLLFLDEPTNGLDPEAIRAFYATLNELKHDGVTIILTSHILAEIQERVDRLAILAAGKLQASGTVQQLREQMKLPLTFTVKPAAGAGESVHKALAQLLGVSAQITADSIHLHTPRENKMAVLAAIATLGAQVQDVHVREASLEDVFFGFAE